MFSKKVEPSTIDRADLLTQRIRTLTIENLEQKRTIVELAKDIGRLKCRKFRVYTFNEIMALKDIEINADWKYPCAVKLAACERYYKTHGTIDRPIIVNGNNVLIDGYIGYLTLKAHNIESWKIFKIRWVPDDR